MSPEERQELLAEVMHQVGVACLREFGFTLLADVEEELLRVASPGAPDSRNEGEKLNTRGTSLPSTHGRSE